MYGKTKKKMMIKKKKVVKVVDRQTDKLTGRSSSGCSPKLLCNTTLYLSAAVGMIDHSVEILSVGIKKRGGVGDGREGGRGRRKKECKEERGKTDMVIIINIIISDIR